MSLDVSKKALGATSNLTDEFDVYVEFDGFKEVVAQNRSNTRFKAFSDGYSACNGSLTVIVIEYRLEELRT